jgi:hypothetical protein
MCERSNLPGRFRLYRLEDLPIFASLDVTGTISGAVEQPLRCELQPGVVDGVNVFRLDAYPRLTARINL